MKDIAFSGETYNIHIDIARESRVVRCLGSTMGTRTTGGIVGSAVFQNQNGFCRDIIGGWLMV